MLRDTREMIETDRNRHGHRRGIVNRQQYYYCDCRARVSAPRRRLNHVCIRAYKIILHINIGIYPIYIQYVHV
jgi:hypothetical protein